MRFWKWHLVMLKLSTATNTNAILSAITQTQQQLQRLLVLKPELHFFAIGIHILDQWWMCQNWRNKMWLNQKACFMVSVWFDRLPICHLHFSIKHKPACKRLSVSIYLDVSLSKTFSLLTSVTLLGSSQAIKNSIVYSAKPLIWRKVKKLIYQ